jgi:predicted kinase
MLCGLPGSGKSTWARRKAAENLNMIILSRDDVRTMIKGMYWFNTDFEGAVKDMTFAMLMSALQYKFDIILDETNISLVRRMEVFEIVRDQADIIAVWFTQETMNLENRMKESRGYTAEEWDGIIKKMKNARHPIDRNLEPYSKVLYVHNPHEEGTEE